VCGIVGIVADQSDGLERDITAMNQSLVHRGPDDEGIAVSRADGVAIAMRRLSILDIAGGHQPMWSESGQHAVVFNGEIYNWQMLRNILVKHGHAFRTERSDTEVLVHGYEQWGDGLFARLNGMFAVIVWDKLNRALVVARDFSG